MNFLSGSGPGSAVLAHPAFGALIAAVVAAGIGIYTARLRAARRANAAAEAARARNQALRAVKQSCSANGHAFAERDGGWQCATCDTYVPLLGGEAYGLVSDGRHERRRQRR